MDGSGVMKVARGKVHKYLGMKLDFTNVGVVIVTMIMLMKLLRHGMKLSLSSTMGLSVR
jgi:hypothetical protein